jgi:hypothetical protein
MLQETSKKQAVLVCVCLLVLIIGTEVEGSTFIRNVSGILLDFTASHGRRQYSSRSPLAEDSALHAHHWQKIVVFTATHGR